MWAWETERSSMDRIGLVMSLSSADFKVPASYHFVVVPIFNSFTKSMGSPVIIHDSMPDCHPVSWTYVLG